MLNVKKGNDSLLFFIIFFGILVVFFIPLGIIFLIAYFIWRMIRKEDKWKGSFESYSPREFELFIGELFKRMGYSVEISEYTKDFGIDLIARKGKETIVVEVKKWKEGYNVGPETIRSALGAMWKADANKAIVITTSDFTVLAKEQAKNAPIELWNAYTLRKLIGRYFSEKTHIKRKI